MSGILEDSLCENTLDLEDGLQHQTHHRMLIFSRSGIDKCSRSHDPPENTRPIVQPRLTLSISRQML